MLMLGILFRNTISWTFSRICLSTLRGITLSFSFSILDKYNFTTVRKNKLFKALQTIVQYNKLNDQVFQLHT